MRGYVVFGLVALFAGLSALLTGCASSRGNDVVQHDETPTIEKLKPTITPSIGVQGQMSTPRTVIVKKPGPVLLTPEEEKVRDQEKRAAGWDPLEFYKPGSDRSNLVDRHSGGATFGIAGRTFSPTVYHTVATRAGVSATANPLVVGLWPWKTSVADLEHSVSTVTGLHGVAGPNIGYDRAKFMSFRDSPRYKQ